MSNTVHCTSSRHSRACQNKVELECMSCIQSASLYHGVTTQYAGQLSPHSEIIAFQNLTLVKKTDLGLKHLRDRTDTMEKNNYST